MKSLLIFASALAATIMVLTAAASAGGPPCERAAVRDQVEVTGDELFLSDLLRAGAPTSLRQAAGVVRLGKAPLAGSTRVLEGSQIRARLDELPDEKATAGCRGWSIPQRIAVRRAGDRASCIDLIRRIRPPWLAPLPDDLGPGEVSCGAAGRIRQDAPVEMTESAWNSLRSSWDIHARCLHLADCVPFLVRLYDSQARPGSIGWERRPSPAAKKPGDRLSPPGSDSTSGRDSVVRPGQTLTLIWDGNGIRVSVPALCLDPGGLGQQVRARVMRGGMVVRAVVVNAACVRVVS